MSEDKVDNLKKAFFAIFKRCLDVTNGFDEGFARGWQAHEISVQQLTQANETNAGWKDTCDALHIACAEHAKTIEQLQAKEAELRGAAQDFLNKVDSGRAKSIDSYRKLKQALASTSVNDCTCFPDPKDADKRQCNECPR